MIRVLVADDSLTVRKKVGHILSSIPGIVLAGEAENGKEAITKAKELNPDVIILDLAMPIMSGLAAIEYIMSFHPCPIIVLSSAKNRGTRFKLWDAMLAGAVASVEKSSGRLTDGEWDQNFVRTVQAAARIKVCATRKKIRGIQGVDSGIQNKGPQITNGYNAVAIGVSTGGPGIVAGILKALPKEFNLPILLVIHISESGENTFVEWLNDNCPFTVTFARGHENLLKCGGQVLVAPPGRHMVVDRQYIQLLDTPPRSFYRPSVDELFFSLAQDQATNPIGVLLTGMGSDGAKGLKSIRETGGFTICQDETTSIVFGMPRAAININAAVMVLPSHEISDKIISLSNKKTAGVSDYDR
ncbi:MAG: chemotaxis protein CheB [Desulfobacteraceae bacterium]|nr:chemotaxis protein CheB [Desulfobacteraceae bacterium]